MLFILFGSTVEMGKKSRLFFEEHGFELIQKFNSRISVSSAFSTATDLQAKPVKFSCINIHKG